MRGLDISLHIGSRDLQDVCEKLGHRLDVWSLSEHYKIMNWEQTCPKIINKYNWRNIDQKMCDKFYFAYKDEFKKFNFFCSFYSPVFSMLYERFQKPIIQFTPLRYEVPFSNDPIRWEYFNNFCRKGIDSGQIIPVTTNKYDLKYTKLFIERDFQLIQNLCTYTNAQYTGKNGKFLYCSKFKQFGDWIGNPNVINKSQLRNHSFQDRADFKALIYVPYSNTLTTFFEDYSANVPMLFPTKRFLVELWKNFHMQGVMSELSFQQVNGLNPGSIIQYKDKFIPDPNDYMSLETFIHWIDYHDFYDEENFFNIIHYDSLMELENQLISLDFLEISGKMKEANKKRHSYILKKWEEVFNRIK